MIPRERDAWRRAMGEASCLQPDDPERIEMQAEVARRGGWAEQEWLALLQEAERWRIELRRVEVPEGLEERLLGIPGERTRPVGLPGRRVLRALAVAAVLLAVALPTWLVLRRDAPPGDPLAALALLALNDHLDTHGLEVETDDPEALRRDLGDRIPFPIRLPDLGEGPRLAGGRRCTLGSHPVCFTTWNLGETRMTLIQLRREEFGLPPDLPPTVVRPDGAAAARRPLDVLLWTDGPDGYALVADDSRVLSRVRPRGR